MFIILSQIFFGVFVFGIFAVCSIVFRRRPSNERNWSLDQEKLPRAEFGEDGKILVYNVRHTSYRTTTDYAVSHYDREYDLNKLKKVWFFLIPFTGYRGAAHSFLSFEFEEGIFVSVSVEIRKKVGEKFSAKRGLFREFELMYVVADERDVVRLRVEHHKDKVFMYPTSLTKEQGQELFRDMLARANKLAEKPEFYNTILNTCITNVVHHINVADPGKVSVYDRRVFLPERLDEYMYERGFIDTDLSFYDAKEKHRIDMVAKEHAEHPDFSLKIRGR
jgi:hypothetical protein